MRILLIEDNQHIRNALKLGLESVSYTIDEAPDGEKGSYIARTNDYDAIILDLSLPYKDGFTVCEEIRSSGNTTPILMLSVTVDPEIKARLLNAGADDYLTKPFSYHELFARVRALLRRPCEIKSEILSMADLTLDSLRQKVTSSGKHIYLTRKEFSLLEYLMRHAGIVVSRGMIMEHVWNADSDPFSNTIEAHILNLRKKVDVGRKYKLIHTIPGRGYKFEFTAQSVLLSQ